MEKKIRNQRIIIAALAVLLLFNTFTLFQIKEDLNQFNNNALNGIQDIRSNVNSVRSEIAGIKNENEQQASLVTSFDYQYGELDTDKMAVPVSVKIVPKAVSGDTSLFLEFADRKVELKKKGASSEFIAEFETGLFDNKDNGDVRLVIKNGGTSETEELDWSLSALYSDYLPFAAVHFVFSDVTCNEKDGIRVKGNVVSSIDDEEAKRFISTKLIYKVNGTVLAEQDIAGERMDEVNKTFSGYGAGDCFELYLEVVDELGFTQERVLKRVEFGADGEPTEEAELADESVVIKDKNGNVVYS